jgi:arylsulfatase A-like enzyme
MHPPIQRLLPLLLLLCAPCAAGAAQPPHILYVTADDLGWKDVGYHGSSIRTPAIDRLAHGGARLEHFYVQPYSTQTRAAVLTGRYPMRYGLQTMQIQWFSEYALPEDERTLAQALRDAGYRTVLIGKWHLGHSQKRSCDGMSVL